MLVRPGAKFIFLLNKHVAMQQDTDDPERFALMLLHLTGQAMLHTADLIQYFA